MTQYRLPINLHWIEFISETLSSINKVVSSQSNGIIARSGNGHVCVDCGILFLGKCSYFTVCVDCGILFLEKCSYFTVCQTSTGGNYRV